VVEPFFTPDLAEWIDSKISETLFRRLAARIDALRVQLDDGTQEDDFENPLTIPLDADSLRGLLLPDGEVDRLLTYYVSKNGKRLNFLTQFTVPEGERDPTAESLEAIDKARKLMERAVKAGDVLDNL
jgi:hypothetical protein